MMKRLLIVGSGMTGASLSFLLSRTLNPRLWEVVVWDKARGVGGRMSTARAQTVPDCHTDLGAQYFSASPDQAQTHDDVYCVLMKENVLQPLTGVIEQQPDYPPNTSHFVCPSGSSALPKTLLRHAGVSVDCGRQVASLHLCQDAQRWRVKCQDGREAEMDAVVLTLPVPQTMALKGDFQRFIDEDTRKKLSAVQYSSRFALGLFFRPGTCLPGDWAARYVNDNACVRFLSQDHRKRGTVDDPPAMTVHTSVPFGLKHQQTERKQVEKLILQELQSLIPSLPEPAETKLTFWRYSQVHKPFPGKPGCLRLHDGPELLLAGDAFSHSNINGAILSAKAAAAEIQPILSAL